MAINQTNVNDFKAGKKDRMIGYYDKWYRYNRSDDGAAYDAGCRAAVESGEAKQECFIIPCDQF